MLTVIAEYHARAGKGAEIARVLARHVVATRAEPGCVSFVAYQDPADPDHFALYERYVDEAAFVAHRESPHFATYIEGEIVPLLERRQWSRYEEIAPAGDGTRDEAALRYYDHDGSDPLPVVLEALRAAGRDADRIEIDDLAGIDEFHALGRPATMALADLAGIAAGTEVVDVGAGLGGPARFLAARFGAQVTAVEPTARFRVACEELTRRAGLAHAVRTVEGSATRLPLADASADVAWIQAVAISVADKRAMAEELRRVLRPGGRLAFFDSYARSDDELYFPLPWADGPEASFVVPAAELRSAFEAAGFEVVVWNELEGALAEIAQRSFAPTVDPAQVGLARLMPDFERRMGNVGRNIAEGRLGLLQAVLRAA